MSTDQPRNLPAAPDRSHAGDADGGFERMDDGHVRAGTYWRALVDVPGRTTGDYEFIHGPIPRDTVLLVVEVRRIDGGDHTIMLGAHPSGRPNASAHLVEAFRRSFEPLSREEALSIRLTEIAEAQQAIAALQEDLLAGPPPAIEAAVMAEAGQGAERGSEGRANARDCDDDVGADGRPIGTGGGEQAPAPSSSIAPAAPSLPARDLDQALDLKRRAERAVAVTQAKANWIAAKAGDIASKTGVLAAYYKEQATLATAGLSETIAYAKHLDSGVRTLGFYTGDGVEVIQLAAGPGADPDEPLTLYQGKRFLDEELLIHLHSGGADFEDFDALKAALQDGPLLDRLMPSPRSVVACGWRRHDKGYVGHHKGMKLAELVAASLVEIAKNEINRRSFLLVRNGRNVHLIDCAALELTGAERLFPTTDEAEKPFKGWDGERITADDIRFTKASSKAEAMQLKYKRLLVLLWGLDHRLSLFGEFYDRAHYPSFLRLDFQERHFRFINDDEQMLDSGRPGWRLWMSRHNAMLQSGSRVICHWDRLIRPHTAGGCFVRQNHGRSAYQRYTPTETFGLRIARREGKHLVVDVTVDNYEGKTRTAKVILNADPDDALDGMEVQYPAFLVLDAVEPADIQFYLDSRVNRADYLDFVPMLAAARDMLAAEAPLLEPIHRDLEQTLTEARFDAQDGNIPAIVRDAVRAWRAEARGALPPEPGTAGWPRVKQAILDAIWRRAHAQASVALAAATAADLGLEPLRLACDGRGRPILYAALPPDRQELRTGPHHWVERLQLEAKNGSFKVKNTASTEMPTQIATEAVLHDWDGAAAAAGRKAVGGLSLDQARHVTDQVADWRDLYAMIKGDGWETVLGWADAYRLAHRAEGMVRFPRVIVPFALGWNAYMPQSWGKKYKTPRLYTMGFGTSAETFLYLVGDAERRERIEDWVRRIYVRGDHHVERLRASLNKGFAFKVAQLDATCVKLDEPLWSVAEGAFGGHAFVVAEPDMTPEQRLYATALKVTRESWVYDKAKLAETGLPYGVWAPDGTFAEVAELLAQRLRK